MSTSIEDKVGVFAPRLATNIFACVPHLKGIDENSLSEAMGDITVQTTTGGVPILTVQVIDPGWKVQRSGLCDTDEQGLLNQVDVNYPPDSKVWWRLALVSGGNDLSSSNLTLTFRLRLIAYLGSCHGPFSAPPNTRTRAQFIKALFDRMKHEIDPKVLGPGGLDGAFICPELKVVQPIEQNEDTSTPTVTTAKRGSDGKISFSKSASINKTRGAGAGAANVLTVKGKKITASQISVANTAVTVGHSLGAPENAIIACLYAGMGESNLGDNPRTFDRSQEFVGVWQSRPRDWGDGKDVKAMATSFYKGGKGFQAGGAITRALANDDPWKIANAVEANSVWIRSKGDSYGPAFPKGQAQGIAEAIAIMSAAGGGTLGSTTAGLSDVGQLARGTSDNPLEDSWTCMQRLAQEVNWDLFASPQPHPGHWGNYLYYISAHELVAQKPSLYIELSDDGTQWTGTTDGKDGNTPTSSDGIVTNLTYTFDNTTFQYQQAQTSSGKPSKSKGKGKTAKPTRVRVPQTPSQCQFGMLSAPMEFNAGDVFVFHNAGPLNGRWIVEDVTHNVLQDLYARFTLGPPTIAHPEPQATEDNAVQLNPDGTPSTGAPVDDKALIPPSTIRIFTPHGGTYGFFQASGTDYSRGDCPNLAARLDALGIAMKLHLIGLSGYRTPAHSVEVGGFANDPHTRGEASDTPGVERVSEAQLNAFGLTRPFPGARELNHIQLNKKPNALTPTHSVFDGKLH